MVENIIEFFGAAAVWVSVGALIGWNFPQPFWAKWAQSMLVVGYQWARQKYRER